MTSIDSVQFSPATQNAHRTLVSSGHDSRVIFWRWSVTSEHADAPVTFSPLAETLFAVTNCMI